MGVPYSVLKFSAFYPRLFRFSSKISFTVYSSTFCRQQILSTSVFKNVYKASLLFKDTFAGYNSREQKFSFITFKISLYCLLTSIILPSHLVLPFKNNLLFSPSANFLGFLFIFHVHQIDYEIINNQ